MMLFLSRKNKRFRSPTSNRKVDGFSREKRRQRTREGISANLPPTARLTHKSRKPWRRAALNGRMMVQVRKFLFQRMAGAEGFEPSMAVPKTTALPLGYAPILKK